MSTDRTARWLLVPLAAWGASGSGCGPEPEPEAATSAPLVARGEDDLQQDGRRQKMVFDILQVEPEIQGTPVEIALRRVPRHRFVPPELRNLAYLDRPLPIGEGQTISQPSLVARMTRLADLQPGERALDVGTGSGYQAALLAELAAEVDSIEIVPALARLARERLESLGYANVRVHTGDGALGLPDRAPFDAIVVAAATPEVPPALLTQLAPGGRLVLPLGDPDEEQALVVVEKKRDGSIERRVAGLVRFVPMTGESLDSRGEAREE